MHQTNSVSLFQNQFNPYRIIHQIIIFNKHLPDNTTRHKQLLQELHCLANTNVDECTYIATEYTATAQQIATSQQHNITSYANIRLTIPTINAHNKLNLEQQQQGSIAEPRNSQLHTTIVYLHCQTDNMKHEATSSRHLLLTPVCDGESKSGSE